MPVRFRDVLQENLPQKVAGHLVLVPWFDPCLRVFPVRLWEDLQASFDQRIGTADVFGIGEVSSDFRRFVYGSALDVQLDATGRLLLPQDFREHASIGKDVYWFGLGPFLEIWDPDAWHARMSPTRVREIREFVSRVEKPEGGA